MVGFLNSHGTLPRCFNQGFIGLSYGLDNEYGPHVDPDENYLFERRARTNIEDLLVYSPFDEEELAAAELEDDIDDCPDYRVGYRDGDFDELPLTLEEMIHILSSREPVDESRLPVGLWIQYRYGPVIAKMEETVSPDEESDEPVNIEAVMEKELPLACQSGNFESRRLSYWEVDFKADRKWKSRKARKPRRFDHATVRTTIGEMSLVH